MESQVATVNKAKYLYLNAFQKRIDHCGITAISNISKQNWMIHKHDTYPRLSGIPLTLLQESYLVRLDSILGMQRTSLCI